MTVYVQRDGDTIVGVYANPQPGYAEEAVDDSDAGVVAFRAGPTAEQAAAAAREYAPTQFAAPDALARLLRSEAVVITDELNILRSWITDFKAAAAAATSLANFQTRVAALPNLPARTLAEAKNAILAAANSTNAD